jgi:tubulin polyglutamylase TTLL6/13
MHLTNYAINKRSKDFVFNNDTNKDDIGHKRSLSSVFKVINTNNVVFIRSGS